MTTSRKPSIVGFIFEVLRAPAPTREHARTRDTMSYPRSVAVDALH
jgi:hypothetical protein